MDWSSTSAGVFIRTSIPGASRMPSTVNTAPRTTDRARAVWTPRLTRSFSRPPKAWEMTTPAPLASPVKNPTSRLSSGPVTPMAARAFLPT